MNDFGTELGYLPGVGLHGLIGEEPAVDIGQRRKLALIRVALVVRGVEDTEEADQLEAEEVGRFDERFKMAKEEVSLAEEPRVVGIETEDDAHAEQVEAAQGLRRLGVDVFL